VNKQKPTDGRNQDKSRTGIKEIADLAGVAIGTVDRALHGRNGISDATRQRILKIAQRAGYLPNLAARMLRTGRPNLRVAVCIPREPEAFYGQIRDGILEERRRFERLGVETLYWPVEAHGVGEVERITEVIGKDVQGLILAPGDPVQLTPLINQAEEKNVRVICVTSDAPMSSRSSIVCVEPELNGRLAAELMGLLVPAGSQVAVVTGMLHAEDHLKKTRGFCDAFPGHSQGGEVVEVVDGHEDPDETFQKCLDLLQRFECPAGLYVNIGLPLPVCYAISAHQLAGKVRLIGTDLSQEMLPFLENRTISACSYQSPYLQGQHALRLIVDHVLTGRPIPTPHYLNPNIVLRSNLHLFREARRIPHAPRWSDEAQRLESPAIVPQRVASLDRRSGAT
jgi:LacI family transcriptional regulator